MILDRIELFLAVAKHQNLGKTAREMHVSASSVCQRLKCLENDFGVKLYKKNKEGIELTAAGESLLTTGSEVLNQLDTLRKRLNPESDTAVQPLTIGGTYNTSAKYLPSAIAAFQKTHPHVPVRFLTADRAGVEKFVRESEVDVAIVQSASRPCEVSVEDFASDNLTFFSHPTHPLAKKKRLTLADLSQAPLIIRDGRGTTEKLLKQLKCRGLTPNIVLRCASPDAVKTAVRGKLGIGILFCNIIEEDVRQKSLRGLRVSNLPTLVGNSYIIYSKTKPLSATVTDFVALLRFMRTRLKCRVEESEAALSEEMS
jgi:DNA-binding transcriptional LysR family regulator